MARYKMTNHPNRNKVRDWPKLLKEFRRDHGLSQSDLADRLQISKRNVENWEEGTNVPPSYLKKALNDIENDL